MFPLSPNLEKRRNDASIPRNRPDVNKAKSPSYLTKEILAARELWGADQAGYEAAIRGEIHKRWPELAELALPVRLTDLRQADREAVLRSVVGRREEILRWQKVAISTVPVTPQHLQAAAAISGSERIECWYSYPEGLPCANGLRHKQCQLLGPALTRGKALVRRWFVEAGAGKAVDLRNLRLTKAAAMRLDCIARETDASAAPAASPGNTQKRRDNPFAGSARL